MSHVTYEWVMSRMNRAVQKDVVVEKDAVYMSCEETGEWVMGRRLISHVTQMNEPCNADKRVMPRMNRSVQKDAVYMSCEETG